MELIRCALNGTEPHLEEGFDLEAAYEFAQQRQITPLLYYGAVNIPGFMNTLAGKKFFKSTMQYAYNSAEQIAMINSIAEAFKGASVSFLKLKGTLLKEMYPYPEMRLMSDADILIKVEEYDTVKPIMQRLGFEEIQTESDHELVWRSSFLMVELHKRLIPSYNKDYYSYFGDGWRLAQSKSDSSEYSMKDEDNFIYLFIHFAKHYRDAGIGIKHLTDFYVFLQKVGELDWQYIEKEFKKLQVFDFWKNIEKVLDAWFANGEWNDVSEFIVHRIIGSGAYGNEEDHIQSEAVKLSKANKSGKQIKKEKMLYLIFFPYDRMCVRFPFLKKFPFLLPIMWVWRWIDAVLFRRKNIAKKKREIDAISQEKIDSYQNELNYVGLDFNFE